MTGSIGKFSTNLHFTYKTNINNINNNDKICKYMKK